MKLLALETATEACSVALYLDGQVRERFEVAPRRHAELALPMAQVLLAEAGIARAQLDAIAVGRGPGAFTGVRLAIALAQGIALALDRPVVPVSTLAVLAAGAPGEGPEQILAAIDARMGEVYCAEYQRDEQGVWHGEETEAVLKPEAVQQRLAELSGEWATVGTGWAAWPEMAQGANVTLNDGGVTLPEAEDMLPIACQLLTQGKTVVVEKAEPVYLRNEVAWKKLPGRE